MELLGPQGRDEPIPLIDCVPGYVQGAGDGRLVSIKIEKNVSFAHDGGSICYSRHPVNYSRIEKYVSNGRGAGLPSLFMDKKKRRVQRRFNGDVIRQLRKERGSMSLEQLAESAGTTRANISKIELARDYVAVSWDVWLGICRALYIAPERLAELVSAPFEAGGRGRSAPPVTAHKRPTPDR